uniref:Uncharacterized protein n=1 Tax=Vespula pensylvanica TaxID=30213 RepID=A0A834NCM9_VESPE|nr:hypothetical protein H0235_014784 [Vespula pensylvanica]
MGFPEEKSPPKVANSAILVAFRQTRNVLLEAKQEKLRKTHPVCHDARSEAFSRDTTPRNDNHFDRLLEHDEASKKRIL